MVFLFLQLHLPEPCQEVFGVDVDRLFVGLVVAELHLLRVEANVDLHFRLEVQLWRKLLGQVEELESEEKVLLKKTSQCFT